jgi:hypothetical protein
MRLITDEAVFSDVFKSVGEHGEEIISHGRECHEHE